MVWACRYQHHPEGGYGVPWLCPPPTLPEQGLVLLQKQGYVRFRLPSVVEIAILYNKLLKFRLPSEEWHSVLASWFSRLHMPPRTMGIRAWESVSTFSLLALAKQLIFLASKHTLPSSRHDLLVWQPLVQSEAIEALKNKADTNTSAESTESTTATALPTQEPWLPFLIQHIWLKEYDAQHWLESECERLQEIVSTSAIPQYQLGWAYLTQHPHGIDSWLQAQGLPIPPLAIQEQPAALLAYCLWVSLPPPHWLQHLLAEQPELLNTLPPSATTWIRMLLPSEHPQSRLHLPNRPIHTLCLVEGETECWVLPALAEAYHTSLTGVCIQKVGGKQAMPTAYLRYRQGFSGRIWIILDADAEHEAHWLRQYDANTPNSLTHVEHLTFGALEDTYPLAFLLEVLNSTNHLHPQLTPADVQAWGASLPLVCRSSAYQQIRQYANFLGIELLKKETLALAYCQWIRTVDTNTLDPSPLVAIVQQLGKPIAASAKALFFNGTA
jgi:hypothetical protein